MEIEFKADRGPKQRFKAASLEATFSVHPRAFHAFVLAVQFRLNLQRATAFAEAHFNELWNDVVTCFEERAHHTRFLEPPD